MYGGLLIGPSSSVLTFLTWSYLVTSSRHICPGINRDYSAKVYVTYGVYSRIFHKQLRNLTVEKWPIFISRDMKMLEEPRNPEIICTYYKLTSFPRTLYEIERKRKKRHILRL